MRMDSLFRMVAGGLVVVAVALLCLTGCQANTSHSRMNGKAQACDLRAEKSVQSVRTYQLDPQIVRVYWAGESSFGIDGKTQLSSRQALVRYLSHQDRARLEHGILLVSAKPGPGFDPLDVLSRFCAKHNVNLYCVALLNGEPEEPAVQDDPNAADWRSDLPKEVHWIVQASEAPAEPSRAVTGHGVAGGPVAAR